MNEASCAKLFECQKRRYRRTGPSTWAINVKGLLFHDFKSVNWKCKLNTSSKTLDVIMNLCLRFQMSVKTHFVDYAHHCSQKGQESSMCCLHCGFFVTNKPCHVNCDIWFEKIWQICLSPGFKTVVGVVTVPGSIFYIQCMFSTTVSLYWPNLSSSPPDFSAIHSQQASVMKILI